MRKLILILLVSIGGIGCKKDKPKAPSKAYYQYQLELFNSLENKPSKVTNDYYYVKITYKSNDGTLKVIEERGKDCNQIYEGEEFDLGQGKDLYMKIESNLEGANTIFNSRIVKAIESGPYIIASKSSNKVYVLTASVD